ASERLASERSQLLSDGLDRRCGVERASSRAFPLLRLRFIPRRHRRGVIGALIHEPSMQLVKSPQRWVLAQRSMSPQLGSMMVVAPVRDGRMRGIFGRSVNVVFCLTISAKSSGYCSKLRRAA